MRARWAITPPAISGDATTARRAADVARAKAAEARKRSENAPPTDGGGEAWALHQAAVWVGHFYTALADLCSAQADATLYPRHHPGKFTQQRADCEARSDEAENTLHDLMATICAKPWVALVLREIIGAGAAAVASEGRDACALAELQTAGVMGAPDFDTPERASERRARLAIGASIQAAAAAAAEVVVRLMHNGVPGPVVYRGPPRTGG